MGRRLHVLQLYHDSGPGGAEQTIVNLSRGLVEAGHRVTMGLLCRGWLYQEIHRLGIDIFLLHRRNVLDVRPLTALVRFIRKSEIDIVHAHEFGSIVGGCLVRRWIDPPIVATVHGREYLAHRSRRRLLFRWMGRACSRIVAVSRTLERFLLESVGVSPQNVETIYNGIDVGKYGRNGVSCRVRDELGIGPDEWIVGAIGSLYPVKGHSDLIKAMEQVVRRVPSVTCLVIGHGYLRAQLEEEVRRAGLERAVRFLGFRRDVPDLLQTLDLFVLPSLSEGLPLSLLEAMAAGKPVVATDVGGNKEVIEDGVTGYLLPPRRPDLLAERLIALLENPHVGRAIGAKAQAAIQERFSLETMVQQYERLFHAIRAR